MVIASIVFVTVVPRIPSPFHLPHTLSPFFVTLCVRSHGALSLPPNGRRWLPLTIVQTASRYSVHTYRSRPIWCGVRALLLAWQESCAEVFERVCFI